LWTGVPFDQLRLYALSIAFGLSACSTNAWLAAADAPCRSCDHRLSKGALVTLALCAIWVRLASRAARGPAKLIVTTLAAVAWVIARSLLSAWHSGDSHFLGMLEGLRDFLANPLGIVLGSAAIARAPASTSTGNSLRPKCAPAGPLWKRHRGDALPRFGSAPRYLCFLFFVARASWRTYRQTGDFAVLFLYVGRRDRSLPTPFPCAG